MRFMRILDKSVNKIIETLDNIKADFEKLFNDKLVSNQNKEKEAEKELIDLSKMNHNHAHKSNSEENSLI